MQLQKAKESIKQQLNITDAATKMVLDQLIDQCDNLEALNNLSTLINRQFHRSDSDDTKILVKDNKYSFNSSSNSQHKLIIGDNLDALTNLLLTHRNKINVIYIDPPYNTGGSNLRYKDKFSKTAWLNFMRQRLLLAHELLSDDGIIFISIDDNMQAYLKVLMDEIFKEENFFCNFIWEKTYAPKNNCKYVSINHDYILCYAKNKNNIESFRKIERNEENNKLYQHDDYDGRGKYRLSDLTVKGQQGYDINYKGITYKEPQPNGWRYSEEKMYELIKDNRIWFPENPNHRPAFKRYLEEVKGITSKTILPFSLVGSTDENQKELNSIIGINNNGTQKFDYPKGTKLIKYLLNLIPNKNATVLDFFAGSGTTGHAVLELNKEDGGNRQFILCNLEKDGADNKNNIAVDVCYERLYRINQGFSTTHTADFSWLKKHTPFHQGLDVYRLKAVETIHNPNVIDLNVWKEFDSDFKINSVDDLLKQLKSFKSML